MLSGDYLLHRAPFRPASARMSSRAGWASVCAESAQSRVPMQRPNYSLLASLFQNASPHKHSASEPPEGSNSSGKGDCARAHSPSLRLRRPASSRNSYCYANQAPILTLLTIKRAGSSACQRWLRPKDRRRGKVAAPGRARDMAQRRRASPQERAVSASP